ncbi:hypothetical protein, partial [Paenarthrobacter nicotinovorans]|uniref:hypothetical protein n=1 Tax=Paenarthrobacter nicotinovorans TaxID=29320 RepID=UPI001E457A2D
IHAPQPQRKSTTQHPHTNPQNPTKPPSNTTYKDSAWSGAKRGFIAEAAPIRAMEAVSARGGGAV